MTNPAHMWSYWRDKNGVVEALECYYPELLGKNCELRTAVSLIKTGEAAIEQIMSNLTDDEEDDLA
jgi:hypothetical protein